MTKTFLYLVLSLISLIFVACSTQPSPTNPPQPTATLTFQIDEPAAITIAKKSIDPTRRTSLSSENPIIALAQIMPLYAAHTIVHQRQTGPTTTALETQPVWLVVLKSDFTVTPPGPDVTPYAVIDRCLYAIVDATTGSSLESAAGIPCPG